MSYKASESDEDKDKKNQLAVENSPGNLSELEHIDSLKSSAQKYAFWSNFLLTYLSTKSAYLLKDFKI